MPKKNFKLVKLRLYILFHFSWNKSQTRELINAIKNQKLRLTSQKKKVSSSNLEIKYAYWLLKKFPQFYDSTPKNFFSKHKYKADFKCLDDSEVLSSDFPGLKTSAASMTSVASTASMASMTSTASFHQKNYWSWWFDHP